jgi:allophanate hydrolase subunit 2
MIEVVRQGLLTTIQDLGRMGYAHLGVARSGALDVPALVAANRLVGNPDGASGLETTLTGVTVRAEVTTTMAVTGARAAVSVDGSPVGFGVSFPVPKGAVVDVGSAEVGVRSYVAFAGGITIAPVLGSRSTDTLSGLGPPPMRAGFVVPLGHPAVDQERVGVDRGSGHAGKPSLEREADEAANPPACEAGTAGAGGAAGAGAAAGAGGAAGAGAAAGARGAASAGERIETKVVRVRLGPRHDWFNLTARDVLFEGPYTVSVKSNRVGARLAGPALARVNATELPSEGIVLGAVQVPADGQPLVFLADHPTTGGYPVIAVVAAEDVPLVAQARPGTVVRFIPWI